WSCSSGSSPVAFGFWSGTTSKSSLAVSSTSLAHTLRWLCPATRFLLQPRPWCRLLEDTAPPRSTTPPRAPLHLSCSPSPAERKRPGSTLWCEILQKRLMSGLLEENSHRL